MLTALNVKTWSMHSKRGLDSCWWVRHGSNVLFHMRRIECNWAKTMRFANLHSIRRMWNTFDPCLSSMHFSHLNSAQRKTELALEMKFYLDFHRVTWPWRRILTNGSDVKDVFPRGYSSWVGLTASSGQCACANGETHDLIAGRVVTRYPRGDREISWNREI